MPEGPGSPKRGLALRLVTAFLRFPVRYKLIVVGCLLMAVGLIRIFAMQFYGEAASWVLGAVGGVLVAGAAVERLLERDS